MLYALKQPAGSLKGPMLSHIKEAKAKKSEHSASYELLISFTESDLTQIINILER